MTTVREDVVMTERVGVRELKASLSVYLRRVSAGESLLVTECRSTIARGARSRRADGAAAARSLDHVWASVNTLHVDLRLSARAGDLANRHLLRGMDALHLASALRARLSPAVHG